MFNNFRQKTAATKYHDEVTEISKIQGLEIQLVSGGVKIFSSCKEGGWLPDTRSQPQTKLIAAQLRTFYAISMANLSMF